MMLEHGGSWQQGWPRCPPNLMSPKADVPSVVQSSLAKVAELPQHLSANPRVLCLEGCANPGGQLTGGAPTCLPGVLCTVEPPDPAGFGQLRWHHRSCSTTGGVWGRE